MKKGLTLVEVLFALVILGLVLSIFFTNVLRGYRETTSANLRTHAVQLLNALGQRVLKANISSADEGSRAWGREESTGLQIVRYRAWSSWEMSYPFKEFEKLRFPLEAYQASLENKGLPSWARTLGVELYEYQINVCWKEAGGERCVTAWTYAPSMRMDLYRDGRLVPYRTIFEYH